MTRESESGQYVPVSLFAYSPSNWDRGSYWITLNPGSPGHCCIWIRVKSRVLSFWAYQLIPTATRTKVVVVDMGKVFIGR